MQFKFETRRDARVCRQIDGPWRTIIASTMSFSLKHLPENSRIVQAEYLQKHSSRVSNVLTIGDEETYLTFVLIEGFGATPQSLDGCAGQRHVD